MEKKGSKQNNSKNINAAPSWNHKSCSWPKYDWDTFFFIIIYLSLFLSQQEK